MGIPPEVPTASPAEVADPDSDRGQSAAAAAQLYFVDLVPRAAHNSSGSVDASANSPPPLRNRHDLTTSNCRSSVCRPYTQLSAADVLQWLWYWCIMLTARLGYGETFAEPQD